MMIVEKMEAWGHLNITGKNTNTFEITKEKTVTKRGDCIIAVNSSKGALDLHSDFKQLAQQSGAQITTIVRVGNLEEVSFGWGSPKLTFKHKDDLVARKSNFTCDRTLMVKSTKAAQDFSRNLIHRLQKPKQRVDITLIVRV